MQNHISLLAPWLLYSWLTWWSVTIKILLNTKNRNWWQSKQDTSFLLIIREKRKTEWLWRCVALTTRSQAVARIADRTASQ